MKRRQRKTFAKREAERVTQACVGEGGGDFGGLRRHARRSLRLHH